MSERLCAHGCEREAVGGALICQVCANRIARALREAPEIVAHLRTLIDPRKAQVYDRDPVQSSGPLAPAPMDTGAVDAADHILAWLVHYATLWGDTGDYTGMLDGVPAYMGPVLAYEVVKVPAAFLLDHGEIVANDMRVLGLMDALLDAPGGAWTIPRAAARYPMSDRAKWARQPCPECGRRAIWIVPTGDYGQDTKYLCKKPECGWTPLHDDFEKWRSYFEGEKQ